MARVSHATRLARLTRALRGEPVVRVECAEWLRASCPNEACQQRKRCAGIGARRGAPTPTPETPR